VKQSFGAGVDGHLSDLPTNKASWMEVEAKAWASRKGRPSTLKRQAEIEPVIC
jgi:hypothetical protein